MDNLDYLFAAFAAVWAVLFSYILILSLKQKQLRREVKALEEIIEEKYGGRD
ncbi:MAG: CcmD family protein [Dehalococcoidia bacterium]